MFNFPDYTSHNVLSTMPARCAWGLNAPDCFKPKETTVEGVNKMVNDVITYRGDGLRDHWQSPAETLRLGTGDCEDYCVLKYSILKELGFETMAVVVGMDVANTIDGRREVHALLFVDSGGTEPVVLDNRTPLIHPASHFQKFFSPIYAVNESDTWVYLK